MAGKLGDWRYMASIAAAILGVVFLVWHGGTLPKAHADSNPDPSSLKLNPDGWLTWIGDNTRTGENEIYLCDGFDIRKIFTSSPPAEGGATPLVLPPAINENGWVAWSAVVGQWGRSREIFLYNGKETIQLTNTPGEYETEPQINDHGWMTWVSEPDGQRPDRSGGSVFLYDGTSTIEVARAGRLSYFVWPKINNHGQIAWTYFEGLSGKSSILLYDGTQTVKISDSSGQMGLPEINDSGLVVWLGRMLTDLADEIWLYDGSKAAQITHNDYHDHSHQINNKGWVTWVGSKGPDTVFLYNGTDTIELGPGSAPQINDRGWVTWEASDGHDTEIFLYDGTQTFQLTDNDYNDQSPNINNIGWDVNLRKPMIAQASTKYTALSTGTSADGWGDDRAPRVRLSAPRVASQKSSTNVFKIRWGATDPSPLGWTGVNGKNRDTYVMGSSGVKSYTVKVRRAGSMVWQTLRVNTLSTHAWFTGTPGETYVFSVVVEDRAGNIRRSRVSRTTVPFDEKAVLYKRIGFKGYYENAKSRYYKGSLRYSSEPGDVIVYKLKGAKGIGLISTKGPNRGRAKIFVDGKYMGAVDAFSPVLRPRENIFHKSFRRQSTHFLKIVNEGTRGRARFDIDAIAVER